MTSPLADQPAAVPVADRTVAGTTAAAQWAQIQAQAPQIAATLRHYLQRLAAFHPRVRRRGELAPPVRPLDDHRRQPGLGRSSAP
jgi:hypothetical protein